jgi:hypothetical protein
VAPGRHQRGRVLPLPARGDGADQGMSQDDLDGMKQGTENLANNALAAVTA